MGEERSRTNKSKSEILLYSTSCTLSKPVKYDKI